MYTCILRTPRKQSWRCQASENQTKVMTHYQNLDDPSCSFDAMYRKYVSNCPPENERGRQKLFI